MLHSLPMENIALINHKPIILMVLLYDTDIKKVRQYKKVLLCWHNKKSHKNIIYRQDSCFLMI